VDLLSTFNSSSNSCTGPWNASSVHQSYWRGRSGSWMKRISMWSTASRRRLLLERPAQRLLVLGIERLRTSAQLRGQVKASGGVGQGVAQHRLAVRVAGCRIDIVDAELKSVSDSTPCLFPVIAADPRDERASKYLTR